MPDLNSPPSKLAERAALGLGVGAAVVLGIVAFHDSTDPQRNARLHELQLAARWREAIRGEWRALAASDHWWEHGGDVFRWETTPAEVPAPTPVEPLVDGDSDRLVFDALLRSAEELMQRGEHETAGDELQRVARLSVDSARRARLLELQMVLAVRQKDSPKVLATVEEVTSSLSGNEVDGDSPTALALRTLLAGAPLYDDSTAKAVADWLLHRWEQGSLCLPPIAPQPRWREGRLHLAPAPLWSLYAEAIAALHPDGESRTHALRQRERAASLANLVGDLPTTGPVGEHGFRFLAMGEHELLLVWRVRDDGSASGTLLSRGDIEQSLEDALRAKELLAEGLALDFTADREELGEKVPGDPVPLIEPDLSVVLRHPDRAALVKRESRGFQRLRIGLLSTAGICLFGGWAAARAMRRERALQNKERTFLANVTHELRTPAASIALMTENLVEGRVRDPERLGRYHASLREESQRLVRLVEDVLEVSRRRRGESPRLRIEEHDANAWCAALERESRDLASARGVTFEMQCSLDRTVARFDADAVRRAVHNLVENACLHSGTSRIELSAALGDRLEIQVRDHGHGVPVTERQRIFEVFAQYDPKGGKARGAGLGLAIARDVARAHGGDVELLEPPAGGGSVFRLHVPAGPPAMRIEPTT